MSARSAAISWLLQRCALLEGGLVDPARLRDFAARRTVAGRRVVDTTLAGVLDPATHAVVQAAAAHPDRFAHGLELCTPVAGFGALLGDAVLHTLQHRAAAEASVEWAALWNLLVAYFDELCDEYGLLLPTLLERIAPATLAAALDPEHETRLVWRAADPVLLRFVLQIADEAFRRLRRQAATWSANDYAPLRQAIATAYRSEVFTATLCFSRECDASAVHGHLRASSSLPVWILGCASAMLAGRGRLPPALDAALHHVGDAMWLADDLVDLEDDVGTDRWNAIFLVVAERYGPPALTMLQHLPAEERLVWLDAQGLAQGLAERVFDALQHAIDTLALGFEGGVALGSDLVAVLWSLADQKLR